MKDHDIKNGSVLDMLEPVMTIKVVTPDGSKTIKLSNIKKMIQ